MLGAIVQAGRVWLRPILMTTSTTVLGLLPMALGIFNFRPMAGALESLLSGFMPPGFVSVVMTGFNVVFPLGQGSEIRAPMAITVIGGLVVSTLVTLVLIPTLYSLADRKE